jgi:hypothetical protein
MRLLSVDKVTVPLQRRDSLTLTVDVPLPALNAHLGVLKKVFQVRARHQAA